MFFWSKCVKRAAFCILQDYPWTNVIALTVTLAFNILVIFSLSLLSLAASTLSNSSLFFSFDQHQTTVVDHLSQSIYVFHSTQPLSLSHCERSKRKKMEKTQQTEADNGEVKVETEALNDGSLCGYDSLHSLLSANLKLELFQFIFFLFIFFSWVYQLVPLFF